MNENELQEIIDCHCHYINFEYLPDKYTIHLLKNAIKVVAECFIEKDFRDDNPPILVKIAIEVLDKTFLRCLKKFLNALRELQFTKDPGVIDTLVQEGEYFVPGDMTDKLRKGRKGKLILNVPLMMDFIKASNMPTPTSAAGVMPYHRQIEEHVFLSRRHPWKIFPFFHYHPERPDVYRLFVKAVEHSGFIGVKLYPAMGFYPDCTDWRNGHVINTNLEKLYNYIKNHKKQNQYHIPITTHAQINSTQAIDLETEETGRFTKISNWIPVIEQYGLKINFGHYGGTEFTKIFSSAKKTFSIECRETIQSLMENYNSKKNKQIFADTSAHIEHSARYFRCLNSDLAAPGRLIMFGSDLPAISPFLSMKKFINKFYDNIHNNYKNRFFKTHAFEFLFEGGIIPDHYINFLKQSHDNGTIANDPLHPENMPEFITHDNNGRYRVRDLL